METLNTLLLPTSALVVRLCELERFKNNRNINRIWYIGVVNTVVIFYCNFYKMCKK